MSHKNAWLRLGDSEEKLMLEEKEGGNIIGRDSDSTPANVNIRVQTKDLTMSRVHCVIEIETSKEIKVLTDDKTQKMAIKHLTEYKYLIRHLGETNDTVLRKNANSKKELTLVKGDFVYLDSGDELRLGETCLLFEIPANETQKIKH